MSYEQNIKEARTIEAMKNGYMGLSGKFCQITRKLGHPIIRQGGIYSDSTEFEEVFKEDENEIRTIDENEPTFEVGWQFDGLSRGMNLSIIVLNHLREITVRYESQVVYKETSGELDSYAPYKEWEEKISSLYELTKKIHRKESKEQSKKLEESKNEKKVKILEELRKKWGI